MSYKQSSYLSAPYAFEAVINNQTEQLRALAGINSYYLFSGGAALADEVFRWEIPIDITVESVWVRYPGAPGGTVEIKLLDSLGVEYSAISLNTNNNGEKFDNAWVYRFNGTFGIPKGNIVDFSSTVAYAAVSAYALPCLFFPPINGLKQ